MYSPYLEKAVVVSICAKYMYIAIELAHHKIMKLARESLSSVACLHNCRPSTVGVHIHTLASSPDCLS